jgi:hypothetical protein
MLYQVVLRNEYLSVEPAIGWGFHCVQALARGS